LGAINRLIGRKPRKPNAALLALTLNNMTQGVVLLDTSGRLIVCTDQYRAMYRLSPEIVKPRSGADRHDSQPDRQRQLAA